jgi:hypothetical protein
VIDGGKDVNTGGSGGAGGAGGVVGTGGIGGAGGVGKNAPIASGGAGGGGGIASTADAPEAGGATGGAPSSGGIPSVGGATGGSTVGSGGATSTGGTTSSGGVTSTGGASSTGGVTSTGGATGNGGVTGTGGSTVATCSPACNPDENCISSTCTLRWGGMTCSTQQDCPSWATCCDGSNESCDGTRLPSGDGTNPGEFVVSGDGLTVTDTITGLVWQRDGSGTRTACSGPGALTCSWSEAQAYCASLVLGGLSGWRLPAVLELSTIVDFTQTSPPTIDQATFPGTPSEYFWATSPPSGGYGHPYIDFGSGEWNNYYSLFYRARCVH